MKNKQILGFLIIAALGMVACGKKEEAKSYVQDTLVIESSTEEGSDVTEESSVNDIVIEESTEDEELVNNKMSDIESMEPEISSEDYNWGAIDRYYDYSNNSGVFPYVKYKDEYTTIDKELEDMNASEIITQTFAISNNKYIDVGGSLIVLDTDVKIHDSELGTNGVVRSSGRDPEFESYIDYIEGIYYEVDSGITTYDNSNIPLYMRGDFTPLGFLNPMTVNGMLTYDFEVEYITPNGGAIEIDLTAGDLGMKLVIDEDTRELLVVKIDSLDFLFDYGAMDIDITGIKAVAGPMYTEEELRNIPQY